MAWTTLLGRLRHAVRPARTAILRGAGEAENVGDLMMRHTAQKLLAALGFETVYTVGHGDSPAALSSAAGSVDAIFVLGSLQFSDAWAAPTLSERLERAASFHQHFPTAKVVFLPSTWGAFEPRHKDPLQRLVAGAQVLVRDRFSAEAINGALGSSVAAYCPDLAFSYPLAEAELARPLLERSAAGGTRPFIGIVPNQRCIEAGVTPLQDPEHYFEYLAGARDFALARGFNVVGLSHMVNTDRDLLLLERLGIEYVPANDVTLIRSVIANLTACICSRYHGLVSCLSHGTPVIALGWHHKYRNLMNDMGLGAYHLSVGELPRDPAPLLDELCTNHDGVRRTIVRNVGAARQIMEARTRALPWS